MLRRQKKYASNEDQWEEAFKWAAEENGWIIEEGLHCFFNEQYTWRRIKEENCTSRIRRVICGHELKSIKWLTFKSKEKDNG